MEPLKFVNIQYYSPLIDASELFIEVLSLTKPSTTSWPGPSALVTEIFPSSEKKKNKHYKWQINYQKSLFINTIHRRNLVKQRLRKLHFTIQKF